MSTDEETTTNAAPPEEIDNATGNEAQSREEIPPELQQTATLNGGENRLGDNQYFFEDQVFFINKAGRAKFGLVIETCDSYSDDENDEDEKLNRGEVRIAWYPSSHEHIRSENTVGLADRTLMPGDVVRRMKPDSSPQRGYVRDIKITADVRVLKSPYVIKNVAAERLRPLSVWQRDCTVCLDSWVGSAKDVDERAILMGSNGVRFEIQSADFYHFKEASTSRRPSVFSPFIFFPGNIVSGRLPSVDKAKILTPDIPLLLNRKGAMLRAKFVVESVRTEGVIVQWQCKALSKFNSSVLDLEPPKPYVNAEQLSRVKRLNVFESCVLQMADRSFLTYEPKDQLISKAKWEKEIAHRFKEMLNQQRSSFVDSGKTKEQTKTLKDTKTNSNNKSGKTQNSNNENSEKDSDWLTTTTATDTSDQSSCGESECDDEVDGNQSIDRSDLESITTNTGDEEIAETNSTGTGGGGAIVKKIGTLKNLNKKTSSSRHKHQHHARQQASTNKWLHKNAIYAPMNMSSVREGKELITETLLVYSTVGVVWQDGTVEDNIPSTQLYPIHHLDNHEFFPGDFTMLSIEDPRITFRDYGVVQTVDHQGRTASVKWFKTYAPEDEEGAPTYKGETEVSVYDLKDHPDFTYRPGGMVIRVSNFIGEDATCTAGQVLDNCIDGRVKVAWDDGRISCCWPQDLYDVGHHEQHDYGGDSDSWETQSENSNPGGYEEYEENQEPPQTTEKDIVLYIDRAIKELIRFEEILTANPHLQERTVMRKLLHLYKTGRYLDRLLQTSFFHEEHFLGLIKRVDQEENDKENSPQSSNTFETPKPATITTETNELVNTCENFIQKDQIIEESLMKSVQSSNQKSIKPVNDPSDKATIIQSPMNESPKVLLNLNYRLPNSTASFASPKSSNNSNSTAATPGRHARNCTYSGHIVHVRYTPDMPNSAQANTKTLSVTDTDKQNSEEVIIQLKDPTTTATARQEQLSIIEDTVLLASALLSIEKAYQVTTHIKSTMESFSPPRDDSGTFSHSNDDVTAPVAENENPVEEIIGGLLAKVDKNLIGSEVFAQTKNVHTNTKHSICCVSFCIRLREQIEKCKQQIEQQFNVNITPQAELTDPFGSCDINDKEEESLNEDIAIGEIDSKSELEKLLTNDGSKSNDLKVNDSNDVTADSTKNVEPWSVPEECFKILPNAPKNHKFLTNICEPSQPQQYFRAVQREHRLLKTSLPKGIWLRFYEDRIDLLSVMMEGPKKTPYENGLYFFDMQLGRDYPKRPPVCHYISYCVDRLNPNLYEEGKVCVSLLGTWSGRDVEVWGPNSTLLQVLVSIQGLILVPEPYFNEAGYEKQKGSLQGHENSRMYNEMVVIKATQATIKMLLNPPTIFKEEVLDYYKQNGLAMYERIRGWMELSKSYDKQQVNEEKATGIEFAKPDFPLLPASRGFCLTLESLLKNLKEKMLSIMNGRDEELNAELTALTPKESTEFSLNADAVAASTLKTNESDVNQP